MNYTRALMNLSALVMGLAGLVASFLPDYVLEWLGSPAVPPLMLLVQVLGAMYLGFAALNWMARENLIGGIYSRPLAVANLLHFLTGGLAILKLAYAGEGMQYLWPVVIVYAVFAIGFGRTLFRDPLATTKPPLEQPSHAG